MTLEEFFYKLEKLDYYEDVIVEIAYKYDWENEYTIENQYLEYDGNVGDWVWLHDWDEGQQNVEVLGYIRMQDVDIPKIEG